MSDNIEELRQHAIDGVESYKSGYRHGVQESEVDLGLARLTIEQLQTRIKNQDQHIEMLEAAILRCGITVTNTFPEITDVNALGYRPAVCDGGNGVHCCSYGCAADEELRSMGRL